MNRVWDYIGFAVWFAGLVGLAMLVLVRLLFRTVGRRRVGATAMPAAHARRRFTAAAAEARVHASPDQAAQPFRPARCAGIVA